MGLHIFLYQGLKGLDSVLLNINPISAFMKTITRAIQDEIDTVAC